MNPAGECVPAGVIVRRPGYAASYDSRVRSPDEREEATASGAQSSGFVKAAGEGLCLYSVLQLVYGILVSVLANEISRDCICGEG